MHKKWYIVVTRTFLHKYDNETEFKSPFTLKKN